MIQKKNECQNIKKLEYVNIYLYYKLKQSIISGNQRTGEGFKLFA